MDITAVVGVAYIATLLVFVFGILTSASHLVFSGIRMLRNRPSGFSWIIGGRWISVAACLLWLVVAYLIAQLLTWLVGKPGSALETIVAVAVVVGLVPLLLLPVVLPLFEIWRYRRASSLTLAVLCVIAFPVVFAATVTSIYDRATQSLLPPLHGGISLRGYPDAQLYEVGTLPQPRGMKISKKLNLPELKSSQLSPADAGDFEKQREALWLDMAICDISIEYMRDSGSNFSQIEFNHVNPYVAFVPVTFRWIYVPFFWGVVLLLIHSAVQWVMRSVRRHALSPVP